MGGHENIDAILINPDIIIFEKGIMISSILHKGFIFLRWTKIEYIVYYKELAEKLEIIYEQEKAITLEKAPESLVVTDVLLKIKSVSPNTEIFEKAEVNEIFQQVPEELLFPIDEQDLRIQTFLFDIEDDDTLKAYDKWTTVHILRLVK